MREEKKSERRAGGNAWVADSQLLRETVKEAAWALGDGRWGGPALAVCRSSYRQRCIAAVDGALCRVHAVAQLCRPRSAAVQAPLPTRLCSKAELPVEGGRFAEGDYPQMSGDRL